MGGRVRNDGTIGERAASPAARRRRFSSPEWSPDGKLHFVSDRTVGGICIAEVDGLVPLCPMAAEFGEPQWVFGLSLYGFSADAKVVCIRTPGRASAGCRASTSQWRRHAAATPFEDIGELRVGDGFAVVEARRADAADVHRADLAGRRRRDRAGAQRRRGAAMRRMLSVPRAISFPSAQRPHGARLPLSAGQRGLRGARGRAPAADRHAATAARPRMAGSTLKLATQFWTSRGFAVVDVNYGGSTGFGRAYRELLSGQWGIVDVEDCIAGARHLVDQGLADGERLAIRGGSAGGYTTLCGAGVPRRVQGRRQLLRRRPTCARSTPTRTSSSRATPPTCSRRCPSASACTVERSPIHFGRPHLVPGDLLPGPRRQGGAARAVRADGRRVARARHRRWPTWPFEGEQHGFRRRGHNPSGRSRPSWRSTSRVFGFSPAVGGSGWCCNACGRVRR